MRDVPRSAARRVRVRSASSAVNGGREPRRCAWAAGSALERDYHDAEWGVPCRDDRALFELLTLEGAQAGLSWRTVLAKRETYRAAFHGFDLERVAAMDDPAVEALMGDPGLVRHRRKLFSARDNARALVAAGEPPAALLWRLAGGRTRRNAWPDRASVPARTEQSDAMSRALRQAGLSFVGSTICYAFMQAAGMVNDHVTGCFRHAIVGAAPDPGAVETT